ncbi:MAG: L,D-transpeptidase [Solirubrobacteraceae bacterium]
MLLVPLGVAAAMAVTRGDAGTPVPTERSALPVPAVAAAPAPGFDVGEPVPLGSGRHESRWAKVRAATAARAAPRASARRVASLPALTPEGTTNLVLALDRVHDDRGRLWVRVRLPVLPANTTGWVPREALGGYGVVTTRLVVDLATQRATLLRDGRPVLRADVGVGTPDAPTPRGEFHVRNKLTDYRSPFYGPLAFGTSARSPTLTDWPAGGFVGIHGTDEPARIPGRISHGCIRLRNPDIVRLARLMPVGTPLTIR